MRILRSKRVRTPGIEAWVCTEAAQLINISATGALMRSGTLLPPGQECPLVLKAHDEPVRLRARIVWAKPLALASPHVKADADEHEYLVAVRFTLLPPTAKAAITAIRGGGLDWTE